MVATAASPAIERAVADYRAASERSSAAFDAWRESRSAAAWEQYRRLDWAATEAYFRLDCALGPKAASYKVAGHVVRVQYTRRDQKLITIHADHVRATGGRAS